MRDDGFTLVELLVVITILVLIVFLAATMYQITTEQHEVKERVLDIKVFSENLQNNIKTNNFEMPTQNKVLVVSFEHIILHNDLSNKKLTSNWDYDNSYFLVHKPSNDNKTLKYYVTYQTIDKKGQELLLVDKLITSEVTNPSILKLNQAPLNGKLEGNKNTFSYGSLYSFSGVNEAIVYTTKP